MKISWEEPYKARLRTSKACRNLRRYIQRLTMNTEKVLSISAIFLSICALVVSIWQGVVTREHNRLSLTPYLEVSPRLAGRSQSGIFLENAGTGAAFVKSASISVKGREFELTKNSWPEFFNHIGLDKNCYKQSWLKPGSVIRPGREVPLITVSESSKSICDLDAVKFLTEPNLVLKIKYDSPYEEESALLETIGFDESSVENIKQITKLLKEYNK